MTNGTLRSIAQLRDAGFVSAPQTAALEQVAARYAVAITPTVADLIDRGDANDPIARQFIPDPAELKSQPPERADPIGDDAFSPVEGVVHRHPDRVLLKLVHTCPVYCRFCFRREMVGPGGRQGLTRDKRDAAYRYINEHPEIWEVILTGGDPLVDRKSTRLNSSHLVISYAVFCLKKKKKKTKQIPQKKKKKKKKKKTKKKKQK